MAFCRLTLHQLFHIHSSVQWLQFSGLQGCSPSCICTVSHTFIFISHFQSLLSLINCLPASLAGTGSAPCMYRRHHVSVAVLGHFWQPYSLCACNANASGAPHVCAVRLPSCRAPRRHHWGCRSHALRSFTDPHLPHLPGRGLLRPPPSWASCPPAPTTINHGSTHHVLWLVE